MFASTVVATPCNNNVAMCKAGSRSRHGRLSFFGGDRNGWGWSRRRCLATASRTTTTRKAASPPWLMLSSPTKPDHRYFFDITHDRKLRLNREIHLPQISDDLLIGSSQGLLVSLPPCCSSNVTALDPIAGSHLPLPPASTLFKAPPTFSMRYALSKQTAAAVGDYYRRFKGKAILSPSREHAVVLCSLHADFARLEVSSACSSYPSSAWTPIPYLLCSLAPMGSSPSPLESLDDCALYKGHLHFVDPLGRLATVDVNNLSSTLPRFFSCIARLEGWTVSPFRKYLVVSPNGDDLFLVYRIVERDFSSWYTRTGFFVVFKLDANDDGRYKWDQTDDIGDIALFVGPNSSTSLFASDFRNLRSNSIYFTDEFHYSGHKDLRDTGVFSLDDKSVQFFELTEDQLQLNRPLPMWFTPAATC